jgi:hypothetical protein
VVRLCAEREGLCARLAFEGKRDDIVPSRTLSKLTERWNVALLGEIYFAQRPILNAFRNDFNGSA